MHRLLGDGLLDRRLWRLERRSVAGGLAVGVFIALTPTVGVHFVLTVVIAFLLRVNIPAALLASLILNPLVLVPIYAGEHELGAWILDRLSRANVDPMPARAAKALHEARALGVGSLVTATTAAALLYASTLALGGWFDRRRRRRAAAPDATAPGVLRREGPVVPVAAPGTAAGRDAASEVTVPGTTPRPGG
jgi:hypothetical protein